MRWWFIIMCFTVIKWSNLEKKTFRWELSSSNVPIPTLWQTWYLCRKCRKRFCAWDSPFIRNLSVSQLAGTSSFKQSLLQKSYAKNFSFISRYAPVANRTIYNAFHFLYLRCTQTHTHTRWILSVSCHHFQKRCFWIAPFCGGFTLAALCRKHPISQ